MKLESRFTLNNHIPGMEKVKVLLEADDDCLENFKLMVWKYRLSYSSKAFVSIMYHSIF